MLRLDWEIGLPVKLSTPTLTQNIKHLTYTGYLGCRP